MLSLQLIRREMVAATVRLMVFLPLLFLQTEIRRQIVLKRLIPRQLGELAKRLQIECTPNSGESPGKERARPRKSPISLTRGRAIAAGPAGAQRHSCFPTEKKDAREKTLASQRRTKGGEWLRGFSRRPGGTVMSASGRWRNTSERIAGFCQIEDSQMETEFMSSQIG